MRGSITQRGKSSWRIRTEAERGPDGKRRRRFETFHGTRKEALKHLAHIIAAGDAGTLTDPSQITVGEYLCGYLDNATHLAPKTLERYRELADRQILPHIGAVKLQKLRPEHLEAWHAALKPRGLSARTIGHAHKLLRSVLARALENGTIARNVAAIRKPPRVETEEIEILSPDQIKAVLEALRGRTLYPIVALALTTGMRRGELLALRWSDVDLDSKQPTLRVERSLEETKAGLRLKAPKTGRRRNVSLPSDAVAMLRAHLAEQMRIRFALGQGERSKPELVFCTLEGEPISPHSISRSWRQTCKAKGLPLVQFHALRHTHASTLIDKGEDILTISRRLGHAKASITLDVYGHLIEGADAGAAKAIEGLLK